MGRKELKGLRLGRVVSRVRLVDERREKTGI